MGRKLRPRRACGDHGHDARCRSARTWATLRAKHYTNQTLMNDALRSIGRPWKNIGAIWPNYGLVRVQWEGPWTNPGVPMRARYRYTHWIGAETGRASIGIFDINCMNNGSRVGLLTSTIGRAPSFRALSENTRAPAASGTSRTNRGCESHKRR